MLVDRAVAFNGPLGLRLQLRFARDGLQQERPQPINGAVSSSSAFLSVLRENRGRGATAASFFRESLVEGGRDIFGVLPPAPFGCCMSGREPEAVRLPRFHRAIQA
jgi:hypothetical protein